MSFVVPRPRLRAADFGPIVVLLDAKRGSFLALPGPTAHCWRMLVCCAGDVAVARQKLVPDQADLLGPMLDELHKLDLLGAGRTPAAWPDLCDGPVPSTTPSLGTDEAEIAFCRNDPLPLRHQVAVSGLLLGLACAVRVLRLGHVLRAIRLVHSLRRTRPATPAEAGQVVAAVRAAGLWLPVRTACLESSLAAALLLACQGLGARWCLGVAIDPLRSHAWVETALGSAGETCQLDRFAVLVRWADHGSAGRPPLCIRHASSVAGGARGRAPAGLGALRRRRYPVVGLRCDARGRGVPH